MNNMTGPTTNSTEHTTLGTSVSPGNEDSRDINTTNSSTSSNSTGRSIVFVLGGFLVLALSVLAAVFGTIAFMDGQEASDPTVVVADVDDLTTDGDASEPEAQVTTTAQPRVDENETSTSVAPAAVEEETATSVVDAPQTTDAPVETTDTAPAASADCSAHELETPRPQPDLPDLIVETRQRIIELAIGCDVDGLVALTAETFDASIGGGDPAELWPLWEADASQRGEPGPLEIMVLLLDGPHGVLQSEGGDFYVWPEAMTHETWSDVSNDEIVALRQLYTDDEIAAFATDGYFGWRLAIHESGNWAYLLVGD